MKPMSITKVDFELNQPPSGGCVLKQKYGCDIVKTDGQPPSGGCVLKQNTIPGASSCKSSRLRAAVC